MAESRKSMLRGISDYWKSFADSFLGGREEQRPDIIDANQSEFSEHPERLEVVKRGDWRMLDDGLTESRLSFAVGRESGQFYYLNELSYGGGYSGEPIWKGPYPSLDAAREGHLKDFSPHQEYINEIALQREEASIRCFSKQNPRDSLGGAPAQANEAAGYEHSPGGNQQVSPPVTSAGISEYWTRVANKGGEQTPLENKVPTTNKTVDLSKIATDSSRSILHASPPPLSRGR